MSNVQTPSILEQNGEVASTTVIKSELMITIKERK